MSHTSDKPNEAPQKTFYTGSSTVSDEDITGHHTEPMRQQDKQWIRPTIRKPGDAATKTNTNTSLYSSPALAVQRLLNTDVAPDRQAKAIFVEMEELVTNKQKQMEWQEKARWVKFEEDVEDGGERWSKPRVASLNASALFELRRSLASGVIILDMIADKLENVVDLLLDQLVNERQIDAKHRSVVRELLVLPHRHMHEKRPDEQKTLVSAKKMSVMEKNKNTKLSFENLAYVESGSTASLTRLPYNASSRELIEEDMDSPPDKMFNAHFRKKLPPASDGASILLAEVDSLTTPVIAMVRLAQATILSDLLEIKLPTKFIFLILANKGAKKRFREIGRSVGTIMSDEVFREVAYRALSKDDVLVGLDEFMEQSTLLPPCEWDPKVRIKPPQNIPSQAPRKTLPPSHTSNGEVVATAHAKEEEAEEEESHFDPALIRTGRICGGLISDIKRKLPWYASDFKDALHPQVFATTVFMYFACLTPNIMFGALLGTATDNYMAAIECLVSGCVCGITFHLLAGQPLTIIGATGPVLIIESIVFNFSKDNGLNYMAFRFWIGMWICIALLLIIIFDMSYFVKYITRFTEESFATLIALIFIYEAIAKLLHILDHDAVDLRPHIHKSCFCEPKLSTAYGNFTDNFTTGGTPGIMTTMGMSNATQFDWHAVLKHDCKGLGGQLVGDGCIYTADVFFLSCLLFIFTFVVCIGLKAFRYTRFLPNKARVMISDFAVLIAIGLAVLIDAILGLDTPKLNVPNEFRPTREDRGFYVNPFKGPMWIIAAAIPPALLSTILIFMDQQITAVIVNRKEHMLKKGKGYHLDLLIIVLQIATCSFIGTPWFVASTVPSVNHVRSLSKESESTAPGEQPRYLGVREQRVSGTCVAIMIGLSALIATVLKFVPMAVLFGVSLYMGWNSLKGLQMVQRILIIFMPAKYQPDYMFLRNVPLRRVHLWTIIQLVFFVIMWVLEKIKITSLLFPLMVLALCGVRKLLEHIFTTHEIKWLDDIIPEDKKKENDKKKKKQHGEGADGKKDETSSEAVMNIPVGGGKTVSIPTNRLSYDPKTGQLNITDDVVGAAIWQQISAQKSNPPKYEEHFGKAVNGSVEQTTPQIVDDDAPDVKESDQYENVDKDHQYENVDENFRRYDDDYECVDDIRL